MRTLYSSVFAVATAIASIGAWAQNDPKIISEVTPDLSPNEVTLSRGTGSTAFIGQAAYRVKIAMNAANVLNNTLFTASTSVVQAASDAPAVPAAAAEFDDRIPGATISVSGQDPTCSVSADKKSLACTFTDGQLVSGDTAEFIVLVRSPINGGRIKVDWSFGGDEGKGNGNGCCTTTASLYTRLIDGTTDDSVKRHVQSYVVKGLLTSLFTGVNKGATKDDPWTTIADLGSSFTVGPPGSTTSYVQGVIDEKKNLDAGISSCSPLNKNECWQSQLTIADTTWPLTDPLWITLERHSSIIKNGTKLSDYALGFVYSKTGAAGTFQTIPLCADVSGGQPSAGQPCLAPKLPNTSVCVERAVVGSPPSTVWSCTVKAVDNGFIRR